MANSIMLRRLRDFHPKKIKKLYRIKWTREEYTFNEERARFGGVPSHVIIIYTYI